MAKDSNFWWYLKIKEDGQCQMCKDSVKTTSFLVRFVTKKSHAEQVQWIPL